RPHLALHSVPTRRSSDLVLGRIEQSAGIKVELLSNSEQRFYTYKGIAAKEAAFQKIIEKGTAILDVDGGSIQISLFDKDTLVTTDRKSTRLNSSHVSISY